MVSEHGDDMRVKGVGFRQESLAFGVIPHRPGIDDRHGNAQTGEDDVKRTLIASGGLHNHQVGFHGEKFLRKGGILFRLDRKTLFLREDANVDLVL